MWIVLEMFFVNRWMNIYPGSSIGALGVLGRSGKSTQGWPSVSGCILGEDEVARSFRVAGGAGFEQRLGARFTVFIEVSEAPSARRGVFLRVLDHKLNVGGWPGNEGLGTAKDFVIFLRRDMTVVQSGNDCAVRKWELPTAVGLNRYIIT